MSVNELNFLFFIGCILAVCCALGLVAIAIQMRETKKRNGAVKDALSKLTGNNSEISGDWSSENGDVKVDFSDEKVLVIDHDLNPKFYSFDNIANLNIGIGHTEHQITSQSLELVFTDRKKVKFYFHNFYECINAYAFFADKSGLGEIYFNETLNVRPKSILL